jgi:exodeoxyribonuclease VII large subunit
MRATLDNPSLSKDIYTVSRLNSEVRAVLEGSFPLLWVEGEISNLARPASGHIYFSLKDPQAQVRCAMFRMKRQRLRFQPENGMQVLIRARVGLYEGRGEFQLVAEHMEPAGEGALRQAFEALKQRLNSEGLFDTRHKQPLPTLPRQIGVITSPSGAAIQDIISVLRRRFPAIPLLIYPVSVQGADAAGEIVAALESARKRQECDLLILTRGGGALEDLMAFNDETVARAIHCCEIPLISAVGHEIDFTIADFVADRRAPTPSAAAEMASPDKEELSQRLLQRQQRLVLQLEQKTRQLNNRLNSLSHRLERCHPAALIEQKVHHLDRLESALVRALKTHTQHWTGELNHLSARLQNRTPTHQLRQLQQQCSTLCSRLQQSLESQIKGKRQQLALAAGRLHSLSPLATLERGYSITRLQANGKIIHQASEVAEGDQIETLLATGRLISVVTRSNTTT